MVSCGNASGGLRLWLILKRRSEGGRPLGYTSNPTTSSLVLMRSSCSCVKCDHSPPCAAQLRFAAAGGRVSPGGR